MYSKKKAKTLSFSSNLYYFITPVWGRNHIDVFVKIGLPSLLSANNLPALEEIHRAYYLIYTKKEDLSALEKSESFKLLKKLCNVKVDLIDSVSSSSNHDLMSHCHREGLKKASQANCGAVLLPPDCIWSDHSLKNMEKLLSSKKIDLIHMTGIRLISETFSSTLSKYYNIKKDVLTINSQLLVKHALHHLHPITESHFFKEKSGGLMPANLFWMVEKHGILAHCFHLHPLYIAPHEKNHYFKTTVDDDLTLYGKKNFKEYIVQDSDEILAFELSSLKHIVSAPYEKGSIDDIVTWASSWTNKTHQNLIKVPIRIHALPIDKEKWKPVEKKAQKTVKQILTLLNYTSFQPLTKELTLFPLSSLKRLFFFEDFIKYKMSLSSKCLKLYHSFSWKTLYYQEVTKYISIALKKALKPSDKVLCIENELNAAFHVPLNFNLKQEALTLYKKDFSLFTKIALRRNDLTWRYNHILLIVDNILEISPKEIRDVDSLLLPKGLLWVSTKKDFDKKDIEKFFSSYSLKSITKHGYLGLSLIIQVLFLCAKLKKLFTKTLLIRHIRNSKIIVLLQPLYRFISKTVKTIGLIPTAILFILEYFKIKRKIPAETLFILRKK